MHCQPHLLQAVFALSPSRGLTCLLHRRKKKGNENRDNRDDDQQLDQRKAEPSLTSNR
jgi:hypothetical protein